MGFDDTSNQNAAASERVGFCQNCGKALNRETIRVVGSAVYCEPCLEARLAGAPPFAGVPVGAPTPGPGYVPVNPTQPGSGQPNSFQATPLIPGSPNPALAALLGLIPGVGAMYNEQYAKGIIHLVIFAVLVSLSHTSDIFGLLVAGWVIYMAIEGHHTARARRDGTPLPNTFGLNDIGERMGFGKGWPAPGATPPYSAAGPAAAPAGASTPATPPAEPNWGAPTDRYSYTPAASVTYPPLPVYGQPVQPGSATNPGVYGQPGGYGAAYSSNYAPNYAPGTYSPDVPPTRSRFPTGALWLIGLGTLFLVGNTGLFHGIAAPAVVGVGMIGLSIWIFTSKMMNSGVGLHDDGSPVYRVRVLRALRGSVWVMLVGLLLLLNSVHLIGWSRSWPYFIILAGVMAILERTAYNSAAASAYQASVAGVPPAYGYPPGYSPAPAAPVVHETPAPGTEEGR